MCIIVNIQLHHCHHQALTPVFLSPLLTDFIINVQILLWGSKHLPPPSQDTAYNSSLRMDTDAAKTWHAMAVSHARQVAKNHVRPDGTTYHIVEYNPENKPPYINKRYTYQGYADNSTWARGQSWALLGFAMTYHTTGEPEFLEAARKVTDKWLDLLSKQPGAPGEFIPIWDFRAPYDAARDGPRDSSAAAIAALAMLHLAEKLGPDSECGQKYLCAAVNTLTALASDKYLAGPGESFSAIFKHAVSNFPDNYGVDVGLIYGECASLPDCGLGPAKRCSPTTL